MNLLKISKYGKQSPFIIDTHAIFEVQFSMHTILNEEDVQTHTHTHHLESKYLFFNSVLPLCRACVCSIAAFTHNENDVKREQMYTKKNQ